MSRYTERCGGKTIAYGLDHAVGPFVQVFDTDPDIPTIDLDGLFDGLTIDRLVFVAEQHGAVDVLHNLGLAVDYD